jgi:hypothetical protein
MLKPFRGLHLVRNWAHKLRCRRYLQAALLLYLVASVFLVTLHQHRGVAYGHECSLCVAAHTPITIPASTPQLTAPLAAGPPLPIFHDRAHESENLGTCRSRAPPEA